MFAINNIFVIASHSHSILKEIEHSIIHGFGWRIGTKIADHLPFILIVIVLLIIGAIFLTKYLINKHKKGVKNNE